MTRITDFLASIYVGVSSAFFLVFMMGQAITGGLRTETGPGPVDADAAAMLLLWILCSLWLAVRTQRGLWK